MRLLLINPRDQESCAFSNHFPPLGLGYVAALTPPGWDIELIDENFATFEPRPADLVGISVMTSQANRAYTISTIYKEMGIPVVLGGIHVSIVPNEALKFATSVVVGEAECHWQRVIRDFEKKSLQPIYGNGALPNEIFSVIPRRDLFNSKYLFDSIQTSRGCPFRCDFCSVPLINGRKYRVRPVKEVVEELKQIKKKFVFFVDDNIAGCSTENTNRAITLLEAINASGVKKHWISQASINISTNEALLALMKKSGCLGLLIGFESLAVQTLKNSGKTQNLKDGRCLERTYRNVVKVLHRHRIAVDGYFCFGYEDTPQSILETLSFIVRSGIDIVNTPIVIPSPGTPLFERLLPIIEYKSFPADWNHYLGQLVYTPKDATKEDFYSAYYTLVRRLISPKEILRRGIKSLFWSKSPFQTLMIVLFNIGYRNLRKKGLAFLMHQDPSFRQEITAHDK